MILQNPSPGDEAVELGQSSSSVQLAQCDVNCSQPSLPCQIAAGINAFLHFENMETTATLTTLLCDLARFSQSMPPLAPERPGMSIGFPSLHPSSLIFLLVFDLIVF
jgi:hypothetical protein